MDSIKDSIKNIFLVRNPVEGPALIGGLLLSGTAIASAVALAGMRDHATCWNDDVSTCAGESKESIRDQKTWPSTVAWIIGMLGGLSGLYLLVSAGKTYRTLGKSLLGVPGALKSALVIPGLEGGQLVMYNTLALSLLVTGALIVGVHNDASCFSENLSQCNGVTSRDDLVRADYNIGIVLITLGSVLLLHGGATALN